ncbi:5-demethoxyubiquinone hydroxylase, mitochondrial [Tetranychus urticae]|uniref:5-demethoxyubiquinone hydroxylase, mitochondrial n=1 Tax=Tetranychus urticae TaxID=32264 RepID=T1KHU2_TETUR|nr:5-demethoxyubiquinone hydroxylase, mitochondrial [Tetranychus urticae]
MAGYLGRFRHRMYDRIIRVDHAGELGADRIYFGQMLALRSRYPEKAAIIQKMWDQEKVHLNKFEYYAAKHRARKSMLLPIWQAGAFGLGFVPALLGPNAAMAVTEAVEKVIVQHYDSQLRELMADDPVKNEEMIKTISQFRDEEQHHHDCALEHDAKKAPGYQLLSVAVENICKVAVKVAEKI